MIRISSNAAKMIDGLENFQSGLSPLLERSLVTFFRVWEQRFRLERLLSGGFPGPLLGPRSGALNRSFSIRHASSRNRVLVEYGSNSIYARIHEYGTWGKGGTLPDIVPVRAKALRFIGDHDGAVVTTQKVSIPARMGLRKMFKRDQKQFENYVARQVDQLLNHSLRGTM